MELWFDFSCPYAYLASRQAARLGVTIDWRPMLLGGVFRGIGAGDGPMATLSPAKAAHNARDMYRWAEIWDEPFQLPAAHPMRTVRALRVLLGLPREVWPAAIAAIFAAYWQRAEDITDDAVLRAALAGIAGLDEAFAGGDSDRIKAELRARTDEAIALGIFGAPAWVSRRPAKPPILVWGQDRFPMLEAIRDGWDPDEPRGDARGFATELAAKPGSTLDVYFDVSSPFAYLALTQLPALAAMGVTPRLVPILLGALFKDLGTANVPLFAFPPAKLRYVTAEIARWGRWWGEPVGMPSKFPQRTVTAQRLCLIALEHGHEEGLRVATALGRAMWVEDRDIEDPAVLQTIVPAAWLARCGEPDVKQALIDTTARARAAQIFGVPSFVVDETVLVWGQDRLDFVARALAGWRPRHG